jgi:hypothetical protein
LQKLREHLGGVAILCLGLVHELLVDRFFLLSAVAMAAITTSTSLTWRTAVPIFAAAVLYSWFLADRTLPKLVRSRWERYTARVQAGIVAGSALPSDLILYLRPFDADHGTPPRPEILARQPASGLEDHELLGYADDGSPVITEFLGGGRPVSLERFLRATLLPWGRTVGLANPAEARRGLKTYRVVAKDDDWQSTVRRMAERARLVVCVVPMGSVPTPGDPIYTSIALEHRRQSLSKDATYTSFFDELQWLATQRHGGKLLLVVPAHGMDAESWSAFATKLHLLGLQVPADPWEAGHISRGETFIRSNVLVLTFDDAGLVKHCLWWPSIPIHQDWNSKNWGFFVSIFGVLIGRPASLIGRIKAAAQFRWLLGFTDRELLAFVKESHRRHRATSGIQETCLNSSCQAGLVMTLSPAAPLPAGKLVIGTFTCPLCGEVGRFLVHTNQLRFIGGTIPRKTVAEEETPIRSTSPS